MENNLFSVFLGTYNAEPWIHQVIQSLESQDSEPFSVVIIDNDSTDKTVSIIQEILESHSLKNDYRLFKNQKNIGAISSFLDQLDLFDSEWIVMIHQDDHYHSNHISTLEKEMFRCSEETSTIFTGMKLIDQDSNELKVQPSISSRISKTNRLANFLLCLQIQPINFPACALRKNFLIDTQTARHTLAFNDTEMLLRLSCISDFIYIPTETIHYRVHSGNASKLTSSLSNDRAVMVGLNELFHSKEIESIFTRLELDQDFSQLVQALEYGLEIRILDDKFRDITRNLLCETLVRRFGFENIILSKYLELSLQKMNLFVESQLVSNLTTNLKSVELKDTNFSLNSFNRIEFSKDKVRKPKNCFVRVLNLLPIRIIESLLNFVIRFVPASRINNFFLRAWKFSQKSKI